MANHNLVMEQNVDPETGFLTPFHSDGFTPDKKLAFLAAIEENPHYESVVSVLNQIGIGKSTLYRHMERDKAFREKWEELRKRFADRVESVLANCALDPKRTLDRLAYLRAYKPEKYARETMHQDPVQVTINVGSLEAAEQRINQHKRVSIPVDLVSATNHATNPKLTIANLSDPCLSASDHTLAKRVVDPQGGGNTTGTTKAKARRGRPAKQGPSPDAK